MLSTSTIIACLGDVQAIKRVTVFQYGGDGAARAMIHEHGYESHELGKNNQTYLLAPRARVPGPEGLRKCLEAAEYACASAPCKMVRNVTDLPKGLYLLRNEGPIGWCYLPDPFASAATVARSVARKFSTLYGDESTKSLLRDRLLRIEVICRHISKKNAIEIAIERTNGLLLEVAQVVALDELEGLACRS
jgi:hypothetical protein